MSKKRRRLGRAHKAAISRGLKRAAKLERARQQLRDDQRSLVETAILAGLPLRGFGNSKYAGKFVSHEYARHYPHLVQLEPTEDTEEWELTFRYSKKGKAIGWTMRIVAPRGTSREIIQLVARRRGQGQTEPGFRVELGNWQQELRSGRVKEFPAYEPADVPGWHALFNAGKLRIERVREDE